MRAVALVVLWLVGGCDSLFGLDDIQRRPDGALLPPSLACDQPQPALASPHSSELREAGFTTTGLLLVVYETGTGGLRQLPRATLTSPFTGPEDVTVLDPTVTDPTFVVIDGEAVAFASRPPAPRHIVLCRNPTAASTCTRIVMIDEATGTEITDDHDGPAVAVRDGNPVMVFSRGTNLFVANPTAPDLLRWNAKRLDLGTLEADDGALAFAGEMLIMPVSTSLFTLHWDRTAGQYVDPILLPFAGYSPTVFEQGTKLELAFTGVERGIMEPVLVTCMDRRAMP